VVTSKVLRSHWYNLQFSYFQVIVHYTFIPDVKTVNKEKYIDTLRRLKDAAKRILSEK